MIKNALNSNKKRYYQMLLSLLLTEKSCSLFPKGDWTRRYRQMEKSRAGMGKWFQYQESKGGRRIERKIKWNCSPRVLSKVTQVVDNTRMR